MPDDGIHLSESAAKKIKDVIAEKSGEIVGIRIGVRPKGCLGLSYFLDFERKSEINQSIDSFVQEDKGISIYVEKKAMDFINGTEIDFLDEGLRSEFIFVNPNVRCKCDCGTSFCV